MDFNTVSFPYICGEGVRKIVGGLSVHNLAAKGGIEACLSVRLVRPGRASTAFLIGPHIDTVRNRPLSSHWHCDSAYFAHFAQSEHLYYKNQRFVLPKARRIRPSAPRAGFRDGSTVMRNQLSKPIFSAAVSIIRGRSMGIPNSRRRLNLGKTFSPVHSSLSS